MARATSIMICLIALCGYMPALGAENGSYAVSALINASNNETVSFIDNLTGNFTKSELVNFTDELVNASGSLTAKTFWPCDYFNNNCKAPYKPQGPCADFKRCVRGWICDTQEAKCTCKQKYPKDEVAYEQCVKENTYKFDCEQPSGC